jgi:hypothetical protein
LAPLIAELDDEIEREHYIQQLSRLVQLDERTIAGRVQAAARTSRMPAHAQLRNRSRHLRSAQTGSKPDGIESSLPPSPEEEENARSEPEIAPAARAGRDERRGVNPEDYLLASMLREPDLLIWLAAATAEREMEPVDTADWQHVENQEIFRLLKRWMSSDEQWDAELFQESLPGPLHSRLARLLAAGTDLPPANSDELRTDLLKVLVRLRLDRLKLRSTQVKYLIDEATQQGERDDARDLFAVNNHVLRELSHLQLTYRNLSRVLVSQVRAEQGVKIR